VDARVAHDVAMDAVARFTELVGAPDPPLDRAALALAAGPAASAVAARRDIDKGLAELDRLASGVSSLDGLVHRLFVEEAFAGNGKDYYDPRNSLLPHVLRRRLGIPITLAVVTIEVGRRAGIALEGVGMPGHFLVRAVGTHVHLDVFAGGAVIGPAECEAKFRASSGAGLEVPFGPHLLTPTPTRAILVRMLENLRSIYRSRRRPRDLEWVLRMRLALPGAGLPERLELAEALGDQARWVDGATLLERYARGASAAQAEKLTNAARSLRAHLN
jgi:regulator of sirC expression with transglutaminase-like and TPR domain